MKAITIFCTIILFFGCTREVELNFAKEVNKIVIEANMSNLEPIYVRITRSTNEQILLGSFDDPTNTAVDNAKVFIIDNLGYKQQLMKYFFRNKFSGYYNSQDFTGVPGRTYTITVELEGKKYEANSKMPEVTQIDSVAIKLGLNKEGYDYLPQIYFKDNPNAANYYLVKFCRDDNRDIIPLDDKFINCRLGRVWNYSVIDDRFLKDYLNGLDVNIGQSPALFRASLELNTFYQARLYQITKETYKHYKDLIEQIKGDGGAYKPSPTTAFSNFSGGAIGFFSAMSVSTKEFKVTVK